MTRAIRAKEPRANIIVADGARDARLPAIELRGAGLDQTLEAACAAATSNNTIRVKEFGGVGEPVFTIIANAPVVKIAGPGAQGEAQLPAAAANRSVAQVYSLNRLLDDHDGMGLGIAGISVSMRRRKAA